MIYRDRQAAGQALVESLLRYRQEDCLVLGIPRGGVVVAAQVAKALGAPLDIIIPRKVGAPYNPEVAIGAVTQDGTMISDERLLALLDISEQDLAEEVSYVKEEISRRMREYRGNKPLPEISNRIVIMVDDGIATGYTVRAALKSVQSHRPKELILAVPVAPRDTLESLAGEVDEIICPLVPDDFYAVGQYYTLFEQTTDQEVIQALRSLSQ